MSIAPSTLSTTSGYYDLKITKERKKAIDSLIKSVAFLAITLVIAIALPQYVKMEHPMMRFVQISIVSIVGTAALSLMIHNAYRIHRTYPS